MRIVFIVVSVVILGCNSDNSGNDRVANSDKCFSYPSGIDSLHLGGMYDSARWYVYTWHCDEFYLPKSDTSKSITFGELPLKFVSLTYKHDTLELMFDFIDKQESILPSMTRDAKVLCTGVGFNTKTKAKTYMLSPNGFSSVIKGGANRFEDPLQPEVLTYIKSNWDVLDNCFRKLAEKKGIKP